MKDDGQSLPQSFIKKHVMACFARVFYDGNTHAVRRVLSSTAMSAGSISTLICSRRVIA